MLHSIQLTSIHSLYTMDVAKDVDSLMWLNQLWRFGAQVLQHIYWAQPLSWPPLW
jgi:hypothetical protein